MQYMQKIAVYFCLVLINIKLFAELYCFLVDVVTDVQGYKSCTFNSAEVTSISLKTGLWCNYRVEENRSAQNRDFQSCIITTSLVDDKYFSDRIQITGNSQETVEEVDGGVGQQLKPALPDPIYDHFKVVITSSHLLLVHNTSRVGHLDASLPRRRLSCTEE